MKKVSQGTEIKGRDRKHGGLGFRGVDGGTQLSGTELPLLHTDTNYELTLDFIINVSFFHFIIFFLFEFLSRCVLKSVK